MQEKDMVLDILSNTKASLGTYATVITECSNLPVRETFQNMRNSDEKFQYDLYKLASEKGFYPEPEETTSQDISCAKATLTKSATQQQGAGPAASMR